MEGDLWSKFSLLGALTGDSKVDFNAINEATQKYAAENISKTTKKDPLESCTLKILKNFNSTISKPSGNAIPSTSSPAKPRFPANGVQPIKPTMGHPLNRISIVNKRCTKKGKVYTYQYKQVTCAFCKKKCLSEARMAIHQQTEHPIQMAQLELDRAENPAKYAAMLEHAQSKVLAAPTKRPAVPRTNENIPPLGGQMLAKMTPMTSDSGLKIVSSDDDEPVPIPIVSTPIKQPVPKLEILPKVEPQTPKLSPSVSSLLEQLAKYKNEQQIASVSPPIKKSPPKATHKSEIMVVQGNTEGTGDQRVKSVKSIKNGKCYTYSYKYPKVQCEICEKWYQSAAHMRHHQKTVHFQIKDSSTIRCFKCNLCGLEYTKQDSLDKHIARVHSNPEQVNVHCEVCKGEFASVTSMKIHVTKFHKGHILSHESLGHKAKIKKSFDGLSMIHGKEGILESMMTDNIKHENSTAIQHQLNTTPLSHAMKRKHPEKSSGSSTPASGAQSPKNADLFSQLSLLLKATKAKELANAKQPAQSTPKPKTQYVIHTVERADSSLSLTPPSKKVKMSPGTSSGKENLLSETGDLRAEDEDEYSDYKMKTVKNVKNGKVYTYSYKYKKAQCDICHKYYQSAAHMRQHKKTVHYQNKESWVTCPICKIQYCRPDILRRHLERVHTVGSSVTPIKCTICGGQFSSAKVLKIHMTKVHAVNATVDAINSALSQSLQNGAGSSNSAQQPVALSQTLDVIQKALNSAFGLNAANSVQSAINDVDMEEGIEGLDESAELRRYECVQCGNDYDSVEKMMQHIEVDHHQNEV